MTMIPMLDPQLRKRMKKNTFVANIILLQRSKGPK